MSQKLVDWIEKHASIVMIVAAAMVAAFHLLTVGEYPPSWFDEIEILETGRFSVFDVHPQWTVNLVANADGQLVAPSPLFHYLAGAVLEALYRLTGGFLCGRILMLLSLPACSLMLFCWLRSEKFSSIVSFTAAILFLLCPNATICAHWYRPDLWCMTLSLGAIILILNGEAVAKPREGRAPSRPRPRQSAALPCGNGGFATASGDKGRSCNARHFLAGVLLTLSVFFWLTSVLFLPLFLVSFLRNGNKRITRLLIVALGGVVTAALLLIPLYAHIPEIIDNYLRHSEIGAMGSAGAGFVPKCLSNAFDFVKIAMRSPFVWILAGCGMIIGKGRKLCILVFLCLIAFMIVTRVYHLRMVYLMPWLFLFCAVAVDSFAKASGVLVRRLLVAFAVAAMCAEFMISVVALNFAAWPEANTCANFTAKLQAAVQLKSPRVYLWDMEHELYYSGRKLGWKMYSTVPRNAIHNDCNVELLKTMDVVVVTDMGPKLDDADVKALSDAGFTVQSNVEMPPAATGWLKSKLATFVYAHGYPSATVWMRR